MLLVEHMLRSCLGLRHGSWPILRSATVIEMLRAKFSLSLAYLVATIRKCAHAFTRFGLLRDWLTQLVDGGKELVLLDLGVAKAHATLL